MTLGKTPFFPEVLFLDCEGLASESRDPAHCNSLVSLHLRFQEEVTGISVVMDICNFSVVYQFYLKSTISPRTRTWSELMDLFELIIKENV